MPNPPYSYKSTESSPTNVISPTLDLSSLDEHTHQADERRHQATELGRQIQVALVRARHALEENADATARQETAQRVESLVAQVAVLDHPRAQRESQLSHRMEDYVRFQAYRQFLESATLLAPPPHVTDEEYLGACLGLATDLKRYGLGRATVRDVESVRAAAKLVSDWMDFLLQLDFRNGPLRRKYDGTKYSLRALETLLYELSITEPAASGSSSPDPPRAAKRAKPNESTLLPNEELQALKKRMEERDQVREQLIKASRDGQKAAKQAIFALHRGDHRRAWELIQQAETCILKQLWPSVQNEPGLRHGSFAHVVEEYVEAKLFATWLGTAPPPTPDENTNAGAEDGSNPKDASTAVTGKIGRLLTPGDFCIALEPEEYVGGLCDLTGELGRYAVQRGTARDVQGVQICWYTHQTILHALMTMLRLPPGTGKKMDMVRRGLEKLERILYEMSLSEAAGGRNIQTTMATDTGGDGGEGSKKDRDGNDE